jgi:hypothetical protein
MRVTFGVSGFYDWEPADKHPGVQITEADVRGLRAKQLVNGGWHVRVEKELETHHEVGIPELQVCAHLAGQVLAGKDVTREEVICYLLRESNKHHIARRHVTSMTIHDDGPDPELMAQVMSRAGLEGVPAERAMRDYVEEVDMRHSLLAQFGPRDGSREKGVK